jgi:hypothetical chaperone protein
VLCSGPTITLAQTAAPFEAIESGPASVTKSLALCGLGNVPASATIGIDFGTTNTVLALAIDDGDLSFVKFDHRGDRLSSVLSALCFWSDSTPEGRVTRRESGPWAIDEYLERFGSVRFLQSFKTFAASKAFTQTRIFGAAYNFEDVMATFLRSVLDHAEIATDGCRIVVGRPVHFAGGSADDGLAIARYRKAFEALGIGRAAIEYEPVAAAHYASRQLALHGKVLIADFGGGTSDFSVLRVSGEGSRRRIEPLAQGGVGVAGDSFDYRIIDHIVAPRLGKGTTYASFDRQLAIPNRFHANLASWSHLTMMKGNGDLAALRDIAKSAADSLGLEAFVHVIENDLSLLLYRAVAKVKAELSTQASALFEVDLENMKIRVDVPRSDFETWIAKDVVRIGHALDETLRTAGVAPGEIDQIVATGGTSRVPAVRKLLQQRFPDKEIAESDPLHSIAAGLALMSAETR